MGKKDAGGGVRGIGFHPMADIQSLILVKHYHCRCFTVIMNVALVSVFTFHSVSKQLGVPTCLKFH